MKIKPARIFAVCLFFLVSGLILSCSKDKDNTPSGKSHKVQFKVVASTGSEIQLAVYGVDEDITSESSISGAEWASEVITTPAGTDELSISSQAIGTDANSTLKVQIYVDDELKKEGTSKGEILVAEASVKL